MASALEIMDKAYKVRDTIQSYFPPGVKVWSPHFIHSSVRFRVKYRNKPIFYAEITYEHITKMCVEQVVNIVMVRLTAQMLERYTDLDK